MAAPAHSPIVSGLSSHLQRVSHLCSLLARKARENQLEETGNLIKRSNNELYAGNQEAVELQGIVEG